MFILLMDHFRQKYTTNIQSAPQNTRRTAAEHPSCPAFGPSFAAGRWTLLLENQCETGVHTQQVFGGHWSSSLSRCQRSGLSSSRQGRASYSDCVFGSSPSSCHCLLSEQTEAWWLSWSSETHSFLPASCFCFSRFRWNVCMLCFLWHSFRELPGCQGPLEECLRNSMCSEL